MSPAMGGAVITTGLASLDLEPAHPDIYDRPIGLRLLWQDPQSGAEHYLVRYPEGLQARRHTHTAAHTIVVLEGAMVADGQHVGPGSYLHHPAGVEMHHTAAPGEHCLFLIVFDGPFDVGVIPKSDDVGRAGAT